MVSLKNGTQAWHLAGYEVLKGITAQPPAVTSAGHASARAAADRVAQRFGVTRIDPATLAQWQAQTDKTTYVFDVRTPAEYRAAHIPGMKSVPGGQLVQETDRHAMVWGARVVLVDDDGVRAVMTAHWMKQMGWDAYAMTVDMRTVQKETGPWVPYVLGLEGVNVPTVEVAALEQRLKAGNTSVVDVDWSSSYIAGHIPGAWYGLRSRLGEIVSRLPQHDAIVFTSQDGSLARLAAIDLAASFKAPGFALAGGTAAWQAAAYSLEKGATRMATAPDDIRLKAREQNQDIEEAMRAYLSWEIELVNQMATDDDQRFCIQR